MTSVRAGPTWNGSGVSAAGLSAWRRAASAMAPWAVTAARARFADSFSSASRCCGDMKAAGSVKAATSGPAAAFGGSGGGSGGAFGLGGVLAAAALAVVFDLRGVLPSFAAMLASFPCA